MYVTSNRGGKVILTTKTLELMLSDLFLLSLRIRGLTLWYLNWNKINPNKTNILVPVYPGADGFDSLAPTDWKGIYNEGKSWKTPGRVFN